MDHIHYPNLASYLIDNKNTMSIYTKIYIIYVVCQGLRYLKQYDIAHLDIKPPNIMTFKNFGMKIIDFG